MYDFFLYCSYYSQQGFTNPASAQGWRPLTSAADSGCQTHANMQLHPGSPQHCTRARFAWSGSKRQEAPRIVLHIQSPTPAPEFLLLLGLSVHPGEPNSPEHQAHQSATQHHPWLQQSSEWLWAN